MIPGSALHIRSAVQQVHAFGRKWSNRYGIAHMKNEIASFGMDRS
jgi:hypothetical protein